MNRFQTFAPGKAGAAAPGGAFDEEDARWIRAALVEDAGGPWYRDVADPLGQRVHLREDGSPHIVERWLTVKPEQAGLRLDHFLKRSIPRLSRTRIRRIVESQLERRDGARRKAHATVCEGEEYVIRRPAGKEPPCPRQFRVLYEDTEMLVVDKPAGLPMHISAKFYFNTLARLLQAAYPDEEIHLCHRIDRETSGLVVVARSAQAAGFLTQVFAKKQARKTYLAIVQGHPSWQEDTLIDVPLALAGEMSRGDYDGGRQATVPIRMIPGRGKPARTWVRVLQRCPGNVALVCCRPVTGRQHQIRAHLAYRGVPIVGDKLYAHGDAAFAAYCRTGMTPELLRLFQIPRQALHACYVSVPHPSESRRVEVISPLAGDLSGWLRAHCGTADPGTR